MVPAPTAVREVVAGIIASIADAGDDALRMHERRFGGGAGDLRVSADELAAALDALDPAVRAGLEVAIENVGAVARAGVGEDRDRHAPPGPHRDAARAAGRRAPRSTRPAGATRIPRPS